MTAVKRLCLIVTAMIGLAASLWAAEASAAKPLTNEEVVKLVKLGIGDEAVIAKIRQVPSVNFKLETDDLAALKADGVSGKVMAAMLERTSPPAVSGFVSPEALAVAAGRSGGALAARAGTLETAEGKRPLTMHTGSFHQTGFGGFGNTFWIYEGARCSIRTTDHKPTVTIRRDTSPLQQVFLAKLDSDSKGNERSLKVGSVLKGGNPFSDKTGAKPDPDWVVEYEATESPAGVWHLTPKTELPPGEYGIYLSTSMLLDFGVDH